MYDGEKLKIIIKQKGFMQKEVAKMVGLSEANFNQRLNGKRNLRKEDILKICDILNISPKSVNDKTIDTKEKILKSLQEKSLESLVQLEKENKKIAKYLTEVREWFVYGFSSNESITKDFFKDRLVIEKDLSVKHYYKDGTVLEEMGKVRFSKTDVYIVLDDISHGFTSYLIFEKEKQDKNIFIAYLKSTISGTKLPIIVFCVVSDRELEKWRVEEILIKREKTTLLMNANLKKRCENMRLNFDTKVENRKNFCNLKDNILTKLIGNWFIYRFCIHGNQICKDKLIIYSDQVTQYYERDDFNLGAIKSES